MKSSTDDRAVRLWAALADAFGMQWVSLRGPTPSQGWKALIGGLTDMELKQGYTRAINEFGGKDDYPPTLVQFKQLCVITPESLGLPSESEAYRQAARCAHPAYDGKWPSREVYHAACMVGLHDLTVMTEAQSRPVFAAAWAKTVRAVMQGEPLHELPPEPKRVEHVPDPVMTKAAAADALAKIYHVLGVGRGHTAQAVHG